MYVAARNVGNENINLDRTDAPHFAYVSNNRYVMYVAARNVGNENINLDRTDAPHLAYVSNNRDVMYVAARNVGNENKNLDRTDAPQLSILKDSLKEFLLTVVMTEYPRGRGKDNVQSLLPTLERDQPTEALHNGDEGVQQHTNEYIHCLGEVRNETLHMKLTNPALRMEITRSFVKAVTHRPQLIEWEQ
ncbi:hypothetical protein J6590_007667 [Homalodisca vitripennis]|nr:hypothetical protein J6590_007667 [Homalodisca vitripennis]